MTDNLPEKNRLTEQNPARQKSAILSAWETILRLGLGELTLRLGTHILLLAMILISAWGLRQFYDRAQAANPVQPEESDALQADPPTEQLPPDLPAYQPADLTVTQPDGIPRNASLHTDVPTRPRTEVSQYIVQPGDTLFGIAEKFGIKPETVLWANQLVLGDNPHNIQPGQELNILPVDGIYHRWSAGDGLNAVSSFFGVTPQDIVNFPANRLDATTIGDWARPNIEAGTWLVIPGGRREYVSWSAPVIPRDNPSVARVLGPGACASVVDGAVGAGVYIWPANNHFLSGFDFNPEVNHSGIDIDGNTGDPVYAADNGVVVYAGWNNWGYGNVVVINHGNDWQTLYAHLDTYNVTCGQSVFQGNVIGAMGSTGNSTGSHLHYEMMYNGVKVNPWNYLP
jgi:murein DD-endopeptidase MepM/ murein hydrolase activator NlpD